MTKRPSLFSTPKPVQAKAEATPSDIDTEATSSAMTEDETRSMRPPSRAGKRVLSVYLDPLAWKQLRQLALDTDTTTQALGEEAVNLLFAKHGLNRSA
jgi:hypothetical protein